VGRGFLAMRWLLSRSSLLVSRLCAGLVVLGVLGVLGR